MKKALIIGLVLLVLVTGVPLVVGMAGMASCHDCGPAVMTGAGCLVVLVSGLALMALALSGRVRRRRTLLARYLVAFRLERPPRLLPV